MAKMKMLAVLGDGGHSIEMFKLLSLLGPGYEYSYLMSVDDNVSEGRISWPGPIYRVPEPFNRYIPTKNPIKILESVFKQLVVYLKVRPEVILSTGASIALPVSLMGRSMGAKVIHIETGSRVFTMSLTGKIMYRIAHLFFVQWETLREKYPKAIFAGRLL